MPYSADNLLLFYLSTLPTPTEELPQADPLSHTIRDRQRLCLQLLSSQSARLTYSKCQAVPAPAKPVSGWLVIVSFRNTIVALIREMSTLVELVEFIRTKL